MSRFRDAEADVETARKEAEDAARCEVAQADAALIVAQDKQKAAEDERDDGRITPEEEALTSAPVGSGRRRRPRSDGAKKPRRIANRPSRRLKTRVL